MKLLAFSLFVITAVFTLGCNAENPVCTTNFCAVGEIFPRSELEEGQAFSEVDIDDSVIFAILVTGTTPVETAPAETTGGDSVSLDAIVADVAAGSTTYVGETLTITAPVQFVYPSSVSLFTKTDLVSFYVKNPKDPQELAVFQQGKTYRLTVEIVDIEPPDEEFDWYAVWSNLEGNGESIIEVPPVEITVADVVSDVAAGETTYVGQTVKVDATVAAGTAEFEASGLGLTTNNDDVYWFVVHSDKTVLDPYLKDQTHTFTLLIHSITPPDPFNVDQYYTINSIFVEAE